MTYIARTWIDKNTDGTVPSGAMPISAENLNIMEKGIATNSKNINSLQEDYDSFKANNIFDILVGVEVWTNANPNSSFSETTIGLDLSIYKRFVVVLRGSHDTDDYYEYTITQKDIRQCLSCHAQYGANYYTGRNITITDDGITFSPGVYKGSYVNDEYGIPISVTAYKY